MSRNNPRVQLYGDKKKTLFSENILHVTLLFSSIPKFPKFDAPYYHRLYLYN